MIKVMVNGIPGKMATLLAGHIVRAEDFELVPYALTGSDVRIDDVVVGGMSVCLIHPDEREGAIAQVKSECWPFLSADFTLPQAVNANALFYVAYRLPFIMGTTGGNREALVETVENSEIPAVIATNMAKPIVALMAMMEYAASKFPGALLGYSGSIVESHQASKRDVSGTARAMIQPLMDLGVVCSEQGIISVRNPMLQVRMGIPESALGGHGYHTYTLASPDGTVLVELTHNVIGRDVYALGALDALRFLQDRVEVGDTGVYSMLDVLRAG